ncbi:hypothetical protein ACFFQF_26775 [Haladaptatus pallidirubidus]|uniref:Ribbon-helix-helix protein, copG family n=1 Tax=Haladaptatus pallidirubidus TaxID=1008152 RepID=A0AAV3UK08_9EURY|nr:hypothetical protein [Haladaptatus pallidirubidus]
MEPLTIRIEDERAENIRKEAVKREISINKVVREKLIEAESASEPNRSESDNKNGLLEQMREEREEHLRRAERLEGKLESKQELIDEKDERIEEIQADKQTLNARLSEAQKAQKYANKAREETALRPAESADTDSSGLLARILGR